ncbi:unnamed protein product [Trichogramma brassicae]|uniref:Peptidase aspartic putative domain-containing protein n=1 Tax=Trichogramma brassicae TaxID=86971 RepID=A0A6H5I847_9HYME|nr:unnamed protein product [Trichogramma brassicae]
MSMPAMVDNSASELMRVLNGTRNILQALKALGSPVEHWITSRFFLTRSKITLQCQAKWEDSVKQKEHSTTPSSFNELCKFLEAERSTLSLLESNKEFAKKTPQARTENKATTNKNRKSNNFVQANADRTTCPVCSEMHSVEQCNKFRKQSVEERKQTLGKKRLCYNCFGTHMLRDCKSTATCFTCNGKHHTLIHAPFKKDGAQNSSGKKKASSQEKLEYSEETVSPQSVLATTSYNAQEISGEALLATASIRASSSDGQCTIVRALVDQCAQSSFVTEALCQRLCLKKRRVNVPVSGIGQGPDK